MAFLRKLLGILVMIAGVLGLVISLAGLIGVWMVRPMIASGVETTITTLSASIDTSRQTMLVTEQALQGTIDSVSALQTMLNATASSVNDTIPLLNQITDFMGDSLPTTLEAAANSLKSAQASANVLDQAIRSFDTFKAMLSAVPFFGSAIPSGGAPYDPEVPLADSLGAVATQLETLPDKFIEMSRSMENSDKNIVTIKESLTTMATSTSSISTSLEQYRNMVANSQTSLDGMQNMLDNLKANLSSILNAVALGLTLLLAWLLIAQVVILTQGYELYMGTAGRMEGKSVEGGEPKVVHTPTVEAAPVATAETLVEPAAISEAEIASKPEGDTAPENTAAALEETPLVESKDAPVGADQAENPPGE